MPITTDVVSWNSANVEVYSIQHYVIKVRPWLATGWLFFLGVPFSSINKTDRNDIAEILLKVALKATPLTPLF